MRNAKEFYLLDFKTEICLQKQELTEPEGCYCCAESHNAIYRLEFYFFKRWFGVNLCSKCAKKIMRKKKAKP